MIFLFLSLQIHTDNRHDLSGAGLRDRHPPLDDSTEAAAGSARQVQVQPGPDSHSNGCRQQVISQASELSALI